MLIRHICLSLFFEATLCDAIPTCITKEKKRDFLRNAHSTEHPSRGCPHLVLISQLSRLKQCG